MTDRVLLQKGHTKKHYGKRSPLVGGEQPDESGRESLLEMVRVLDEAGISDPFDEGRPGRATVSTMDQAVALVGQLNAVEAERRRLRTVLQIDAELDGITARLAAVDAAEAKAGEAREKAGLEAERHLARLDADVQSYELRKKLVAQHLKEARERKDWKLASALLRTAAEEEEKLLEMEAAELRLRMLAVEAEKAAIR